MKLRLLLLSILCMEVSADVTVYEHDKYNGKSWKLAPGRYNWDEVRKSPVGDDKISSVKVDKGYKVTLYHDPNFKTKPQSYTANSSYVGNANNDKTSSIIVEKLFDNNTPAAIYSSSNFKGNCQGLFIGKYDKAKLDKLIGGKIQSLKLNKGFKATLYTSTNCTGNGVTITSNTSNISSKLNNAQSLFIDRAFNKNAVTIASDSDFNGSVNELSEGDYTTKQMGMKDNDISSVFVPKGYVVILHDHDNFSGNSVGINAANSDIKVDKIADFEDKTSSIEVSKIDE